MREWGVGTPATGERLAPLQLNPCRHVTKIHHCKSLYLQHLQGSSYVFILKGLLKF